MYIPSTDFLLDVGPYIPESHFLFEYEPGPEFSHIPGIIVPVAVVFDDTRPIDPLATIPWAAPAALNASRRVAVEQGSALDTMRWIGWDSPVPLNPLAAVRVADAGQQFAPAFISPWGRPLPLDAVASINTDDAAIWLNGLLLSSWDALRIVDGFTRSSWETPVHGARRERVLPIYFYGPADFVLQAGPYRPGADFLFDYSVQPIQPICLDAASVLPWGRPAVADVGNVIVWGGGRALPDINIGVEFPVYEGPLKPEPVEPDIEDAYIVANIVNAVVLPSRTPIDLANISLGLDIDSYCWAFSAEVLNDASMLLLRPGAALAEIEITLNGQAFVVIVERWQRRRGVGNRYQITGASRHKYLGAPYFSRGSHVEANAISAKQAVEQELADSPFTAEWHTEFADWSIPGGVWGYSNKTPIEAIGDVLDAAGAVIIPHPSADTLLIQPRYYSAPWDWPGLTVDARIHDSMIVSQDGEAVPDAEINRVWVGGVNAGVMCEVTRSGTGGELLGQDVFHDLITDVTAATMRGKQIIAGSGSHTIERLETWITDEEESPGLILPGWIIQVEGVETWRGLVLSVSLSIPGNGSPRVSQQISVERNNNAGARMTATVNQYRRFRDLTGHSLRYVARVVSVDPATGTSIVSLRDQQARVRGVSVPSGNNAVVENGQITGPAPDLPVFYVTV